MEKIYLKYNKERDCYEIRTKATKKFLGSIYKHGQICLIEDKWINSNDKVENMVSMITTWDLYNR